MGFYIKGMEMPKSCYDCPLAMKSYATLFANSCKQTINSYACALTHKAITSTKRNRFCPLVPIPPHGRLIDADALGIRDSEKQAYEEYLREKGEFFIEEPLLEYLRGRSDGLMHASGLVRFSPTIIEAEVDE